MDINGKVAIVTGGASGLGQATVEAYVARGAKVAIFDLNEARANEIIDELGADKVAFWSVNVADEQAVKAAVAAVVEKFGALHICNNYAGIGSASKTLGKNGPFPIEQWQPVIDINLTGTFNVSRYAAEQMAKMARDLASYGIRVNTIVPGLIHTPLFDMLPEPAYKSLEASVVYPPRLGKPKEIAHLAVFMAENDYLNGECVRLDGAIRMQPR